MYSVHVVALAAHLLPVLNSYGPIVVWSSAEHQNCAPQTAVLSKNGDLAVIFDKDVAQPRHVYVRLRGKAAETLALPGPGARSDDELIYQQHFESVAVSTDGTVFASAATFFSGAWSGANEKPLVHAPGRSWAPLPFKNVLGTTNATIAAVDSSSRFALNGDFTDTLKNLDLAYADPNYQRPRSERVDGSTATPLGYGIVTSLRGDYVAGYVSGNPFHPAPGNALPTVTALLWRNGVRATLGRGVACDVNVHGVAAGSDEARLGTGGRPVVWRAGTARTIGSGNGMAYAIDDDGVVVGSIGQRAFVYASQARAPQPTFLDTVVTDRTWHIDTAYGIANDGDILAIGHKAGHGSQLLVLTAENPTQR